LTSKILQLYVEKIGWHRQSRYENKLMVAL